MILSHDQRIVEMRFDNDNFERNVQTTLGTLDTLKARLGLLDSSKLGLEYDDRAVSGINNISNSVDALSNKFNAVGIIGKRVLENLTDSAVSTAKAFANTTIGQIQTGGKQRALNIEQAKYLMKGLDLDWDLASKSINHAVQDTAYGFDEAAMAAAELSASGIKLGEDMDKALGSISGIAAMTNREYSEMAQIFVAVASTGKVMASELNRIRGVNVRALLAEHYGITEAELREEMGSGNLVVDPQTFFNVIYDKFYATAKEANTTFSGAQKNLKSAMNRIGELYYGGVHDEELGIDFDGFHESQRRIYNAMIPVLNTIKDFAKESEILHRVLGHLEKKASFFETFFKKGVDYENATNPFEGLGIRALSEMASAINVFAKEFFKITDKVSESWKKVFPNNLPDLIKVICERLETFTATFKISDETLEKIGKRAESVFEILKAGVKVLKSAFDIFRPFIRAALTAFGIVLDFFGYLAQLINGTRDIREDLNATAGGFERFAENASAAASSLADWLEGVREAVREGDAFAILAANIIGAFRWIAEMINLGILKLKEFAAEAGVSLDPKSITIEGVAEVIKRVIDVIFDLIGHVGKNISELFKPITDAIWGGLDKLLNGTQPKNIVAFATGGGIVYLFYKLGQIFNRFKAWAGLLPPAIDSLLFGISKSMKYKAYALMTIAAVGSIIAAVVAFGNMPQEKLDRGIDAVRKLAGLAFLIVAFFQVLSMINAYQGMQANMSKKFGDQLKSVTTNNMMFAIAANFVSLGIAVGIMARAVKNMADLKPTEFAKGLGALLFMTVLIAGTMISIQKIGGKKLGDTWKSIAALSLVFFALSSVLKSAKSIVIDDVDQLLNYFILFGGIVSMLALGVAMLYFAKDVDWKPIAALSLMFLSIGKLVRSTVKLGKLHEKGLLGPAMLAMTGLMLMMGAMVWLAKKAGETSKSLAAAGLAFVLMAVAIDIMMPAVMSMSLLPWQKLLKSVVALWAIVAIMSKYAILAGSATSMLGGAAAMLIMAAALNALIIPIVALGNMGFSKLLQGAIAALVILYSVAAIAFHLSDSAAMAAVGAASMLIMAIALNALILPIMALSTIPLPKLAKAVGALLMLALVLGAMVTIVSLVAGKFPVVLAAMPIFAASVLLLSAAMLVGSFALGVFVGALTALFAVFVHFKDHVATIAQFIAIVAGLSLAFAAVGIGLIMFGGGLIIVATAIAIFSAAMFIMSIAVAIGAGAFTSLVLALVRFMQAADELQNHIQTLSNLVEVLSEYGLVLAKLGVGGIVFGVGLVAFGLGCLVAAAGVFAASKALEVFSEAFYNLTRVVQVSAQVMINMFAGLIDYAFGVAEALAIVTGKISEDDLKKLQQTRSELKKALNDSGINDVHNVWANSIGTDSRGILRKGGYKAGTTVSDGFSHGAGSFSLEKVQNGIKSGLGKIDFGNIASNWIGGSKKEAIASSITDLIGGGIGEADFTDVFSVMSNNIGLDMESMFKELDTSGITSGLTTAFDGGIEGIDVESLTGNLNGKLEDMVDVSIFEEMDTSSMTGNIEDMFGDAFNNASVDDMIGDLKNNITSSFDMSGFASGESLVESISNGAKTKSEEIGLPTAETMVAEFIDPYEEAIEVEAYDAGENTDDILADGIEDNAGVVENAATAVSDVAVEAFSRYDGAYNSAIETVNGYIAGFADESKLKELKKVSGNIYNIGDKALRKAAIIKSPSRKMKELGELTIEGYGEGVKEGVKDETKNISDSMGSVTEILKRAVDPTRKLPEIEENIRNKYGIEKERWDELSKMKLDDIPNIPTEELENWNSALAEYTKEFRNIMVEANNPLRLFGMPINFAPAVEMGNAQKVASGLNIGRNAATIIGKNLGTVVKGSMAATGIMGIKAFTEKEDTVEVVLSDRPWMDREDHIEVESETTLFDKLFKLGEKIPEKFAHAVYEPFSLLYDVGMMEQTGPLYGVYKEMADFAKEQLFYGPEFRENKLIESLAGPGATIADALDVIKIKISEITGNQEFGSKAIVDLLQRNLSLSEESGTYVSPYNLSSTAWDRLYDEDLGITNEMSKAIKNWAKKIKSYTDGERDEEWKHIEADIWKKNPSAYESWLERVDDEDYWSEVEAKFRMHADKSYKEYNDIWSTIANYPKEVAHLITNTPLAGRSTKPSETARYLDERFVESPDADRLWYEEKHSDKELQEKLDEIIKYEKYLDEYIRTATPYEGYQHAIWAELGYGGTGEEEEWKDVKDKTSPFKQIMGSLYQPGEITKEIAPDLWLKNLIEYVDSVSDIYTGSLEQQSSAFYDTEWSLAKFDDETNRATERLTAFVKAFADVDDVVLKNRFGADVVKSTSVKVDEPWVVTGTLLSSSSVKDTKTREKNVTSDGTGVKKTKSGATEGWYKVHGQWYYYPDDLKEIPTYWSDIMDAASASGKAGSYMKNAGITAASSIISTLRSKANEEAKAKAERDIAYKEAVAEVRKNNFLLGSTLSSISKDKAVYIDGNKLVGAVTSKLDKTLGTNVARKARGS